MYDTKMCNDIHQTRTPDQVLQGGPGCSGVLFGGPPGAHTSHISLKWPQFPFYYVVVCFFFFFFLC